MALDNNLVSIAGTAIVAADGVPVEVKGGSVVSFYENDDGSITGIPDNLSPEVDSDHRMRTGSDMMLDNEIISYTAQNTGKHVYTNTTMTMAWAIGGISSNASGITTTTTGVLFNTRAFFPVYGSASLYCESAMAFDAQPTTNTILDFGLFQAGAANPFTPADGVMFRLTSAGMQGIASFNGSETSTGVFPVSDTDATPWTYVNNKKYQFIIVITQRGAEFWIDNVKYGVIEVPAGSGQICASASLPFSFRHVIAGGAAGAVLKGNLAYYSVSLGGPNLVTTPSTNSARTMGAYQGLSGGTMGSNQLIGTITSGNAANPVPAVPTTTTAALGAGLGGKFLEIATLAVNTDAIIMSFQVPAGGVATPGRRLVLRGIYLQSYVQTVIAGGPWVDEYFLAFGHTAVSLATAESATGKAPRRVMLPLTQTVTANQAVSTAVAQQQTFVDLGDAPIFVNPGEFVQLCKRRVGTVGTSGTIAHNVTPVYGWE